MNNNQVRKSFYISVIVVIVLAILGGGVFGLYAKHKKTTTFTASRNVLVSHNLKENERANSGQDQMTQADLNMMKTYQDVAEDSQVASTTHKMLPKKLRHRYSAHDLGGIISAKTNDQSLVLKISAHTSRPKDAKVIANTSTRAFKQVLPKEQPGAGHVSLLGKATDQSVESHSHPSIKKYGLVGIVLGGLAGIVISVGYVTIRNMK